MMNGTCYIVGASPELGRVDFTARDGDLVIAADGGFLHLKTLGIAPDVVIGDFDSLDFVPPSVTVLRHPQKKDDTDMMLAIRYGLDLGYSRFEIYGGLGGRLDHTFANIQALTYLARHGARGTLVGADTRATVICSGCAAFDADAAGTVSVFALDEAVTGVTETGLPYRLDDAVLTNANPVGVSNEFIGVNSEISVKSGALLIIYSASSP